MTGGRTEITGDSFPQGKNNQNKKVMAGVSQAE